MRDLSLLVLITWNIVESLGLVIDFLLLLHSLIASQKVLCGKKSTHL